MPTPQALAGLKKHGDSMAAIFSYCQAPQDTGMKFFRAAGITDKDHYSLCCTTSREEVEGVIKDISIETPVSLGARAKIRLAFQVARVVHGMAEPPAPIIVQQAPSAGAAILHSEVVTKKELATGVITLGDTVWQTSRAEVKLLTK